MRVLALGKVNLEHRFHPVQEHPRCDKKEASIKRPTNGQRLLADAGIDHLG